MFTADSFDRALQTPATVDKDLGLILSCFLVDLCQVNPAKACNSPTNIAATPALIRSTVDGGELNCEYLIKVIGKAAVTSK